MHPPMDIREWIQGVVAEEQRGTPDRLGMPDFLQPRQPLVEPGGVKSRKRKKNSADSSFLEEAVRPNAIQQRKYAGSLIRSPSQSPTSPSSCPSAPSESLRRPSKNSCELYKRQARRKTRSDRYDSKLKRPPTKGLRQHKQHQVKEGKIERANGKRTSKTGRILHIRANNVVTDRLTLRNTGSIGVFGKVKTSADNQHHELPDLAFSWIKYPQTNRDKAPQQVTDESASAIWRENLRRDGETSTYFAKSRVSGNHAADLVATANDKILRISRPKHTARLNSGSTGRSVIPTIESRDDGTNLSKSEVAGDCSSSYITRTEAGLRSRAAANSKQPVDTIGLGEFKFKPGPYRSSSLGAVRELVDSAIQRDRAPRRARSDQVNYSANLSGETRSRVTFRDQSLSDLSAQHFDRQTFSLTHRSANNNDFEPQKEAPDNPPNFQSQNTQCELYATYRLTDGIKSVQHIPRNREKRAGSVFHESSSSSIVQLLQHCGRIGTIAGTIGQTYQTAECDQSLVRQLENASDSYDLKVISVGSDSVDFIHQCHDYPIHPESRRSEKGCYSPYYKPETYFSVDYSNLHAESHKQDQVWRLVHKTPKLAQAVHFNEATDERKQGADPLAEDISINIPCVGGLQLENLLSMGSKTAVDVVPSFWRPNKLY